ncbi:DNA helicase PIF1, ATP-dependent [Corchorus olitorius]|uniref:DNA helicase PIF1, ATP-dependent n=1 Tax=Corchorus olitorius TaxID=93759 RepID=A0A1R3KJ59_9ROSI|nr:DNA helicase PIF1, ATP-dependent [Corchorus olitorius]
MGLWSPGLDHVALNSMSEFNKWVLDLKLPRKSFNRDEEPDDPNYLKDEAILSPTNEDLDQVNDFILSQIPGETKRYLSFDKIALDSGYMDEQSTPTELLNTSKFSGISNPELLLKVGVLVILMRNINQAEGLCNDTMLIFRKLGTRIVKAEVVIGSNIGKKRNRTTWRRRELRRRAKARKELQNAAMEEEVTALANSLQKCHFNKDADEEVVLERMFKVTTDMTFEYLVRQV